MPKQDTWIIIVGMHRSGTSAMTGLLAACGARTGDDLLPPNVSNPRGYFESRALVAINNKLLQIIGSGWDATERLPEQWWELPELAPIRAEIADFLRPSDTGACIRLMKDPRLSRTLPIWLRVFASLGLEPLIVLCAREPAAVAQSQRVMKGFPYLKSLMLYVDYCLQAERHSRGVRRCIVQYADLVTDWVAVVEQIQGSLGIDFGQDWRQRANGFILPELNRYQDNELGAFDACGRLATMARDTYHGLVAGDLSILDGLVQQYQDYQQLIMPWALALQHLARLEDRLALDYQGASYARTRMATLLGWTEKLDQTPVANDHIKCWWPEEAGRHTLTLRFAPSAAVAKLRLTLVERPALVRVHSCSVWRGDVLLHRWETMGETSNHAASAHELPTLSAEATSGWLLTDSAAWIDLFLPEHLQHEVVGNCSLILELEAEDQAHALKPLLSQLQKTRLGLSKAEKNAARAEAQARAQQKETTAAHQLAIAHMADELTRAEAQLSIMKELLLSGPLQTL